MDTDEPLHQYSHVLANLVRGGKTAALFELHLSIIDELKQGIAPEREDLLLLLESIKKPDRITSDGKNSHNFQKQQVMELIKAIMVLLEQDDFHQGVKSYHLNLMKREPINALERQLKTRNYVDVLSMLSKK